MALDRYTSLYEFFTRKLRPERGRSPRSPMRLWRLLMAWCAMQAWFRRAYCWKRRAQPSPVRPAGRWRIGGAAEGGRIWYLPFAARLPPCPLARERQDRWLDAHSRPTVSGGSRSVAREMGLFARNERFVPSSTGRWTLGRGDGGCCGCGSHHGLLRSGRGHTCPGFATGGVRRKRFTDPPRVGAAMNWEFSISGRRPLPCSSPSMWFSKSWPWGAQYVWDRQWAGLSLRHLVWRHEQG